jgi:hypothetical protein
MEQGAVPYSRPTIEERCNSVTNITIQRNTKSYNVDDNLQDLKRNHHLFISREKPLTIRTRNINFTTVRYGYYSLMTYNLFNNRIRSLPVLCYHTFLHLKVRNTWTIVYRIFITCISKG